MLVVGLTGGIASGKSTVSRVLTTKHHLPLIDLDLLARTAVAPGSYALSSLVSHFGPSILLPDHSLDRAKLGEIIFDNDKQRKVLNGIVHPAVRRLLVWELIKFWLKGERVVIVDAPLLVEAGLWKFCGAIIVVYCSETLQLQRLIHRNALSPAAAQSRISSQTPLAKKLSYADYVLDNSGSLSELELQLDQVVRKLRARIGGVGWFLSWIFPPFGLLRGVWTLAFRGWKKRDSGRGKRGTRGEKRVKRKEEERENIFDAE